MKVEVFLTSHTVTEEDVKGRTVIVIDVLRASSTIATALSNGARAVVPVADMAEAGKIATNLDQASYLMGGERGGVKIEGYHLGNSPLEYSQEAIADRTIIFNTTNGTGSIRKAKAAKHLVVGCFLNASPVVAFAQEKGLDVVIVCAGWYNRISLEDTLCAGLLLHQLWEGQEPPAVTDTAHIAFTQYHHDQHDMQAALRRCNHAQRLSNLGFDADVDYCIQLDALPTLPYYDDNSLVLYQKPETAATSQNTASPKP